MGASGHNIETAIKESARADSYPEDIVIPLTAWVTAAMALPGTTFSATPYYATFGTTHVLRWQQDSGTAVNMLRTMVAVPGCYDETVDRIELLASLRKFDPLGVDENADLKMQARMTYQRLGEVNPRLGNTTVPGAADLLGEPWASTKNTTAERTLAAAQNTGEFRWYAFDLSFNGGQASLPRNVASGNPVQDERLRPGDMMHLDLFPHETVGTSDMVVDMCATILRIWRHATVRSVKAVDRARIFASL